MLGQQLVPAVPSGRGVGWPNSRIEAWVAGFSSIWGMEPQSWQDSGRLTREPLIRSSRVPFRRAVEQRRELVALREAKDRAERADRMKSRFVANASHEIRNMLGAVIAYSELLRDKDQGPEERAEVVDGISRSSAELMTLVNDLIEMAKMEEGRLEVEKREFDLRAFVHDLENYGRVETRRKGIGFQVELGEDVPLRLMSDPCRIKQVLLNVLGNAIKFTESGEVKLKIFRGRGRGVLRFRVSDTGVGMRAEQVKHLFEPFAQFSQSSDVRRRGAGLGLWISRDIARLLGGELEVVESRPGVGTTFELTLRDCAASETRLQAVSSTALEASAEVFKGIKILIADDSVEIRELTSRLLSRSGAYVETVGDGIQAVEKAESGTYDVILMDLQMPRLDGYCAIRKLREKGSIVPVVALTAHTSDEESARCLRAGFTLHLTKPVCREGLIRAISKLVHA